MDIEHEDVVLKDRGVKNGIQKFIVVDKSTNKETGVIFKIVSEEDNNGS